MSAASVAVVASLALFSTASAKQWIEAADSTPTWHSILLSEQYGVFRCLDNRDGRKSLGNPVQAWECNENNNQQWRWIDALDREGNLPAEQRAKLLDAQRDHPPFIYQLKDTELCLGYAMDSVDLKTAKDIQLGLWPCSQAPAFFYDRATNAIHLYGNSKLPQPDDIARKFFINGPQDSQLEDGSLLPLHKEGRHTIQYFNMGHVSD